MEKNNNIEKNNNMEKFEEIFMRNLPKIPYKLEPIYLFDWLILGNLKDALTKQTDMNIDAVLSVFNDADYFKDQFSKKDWCLACRWNLGRRNF